MGKLSLEEARNIKPIIRVGLEKVLPIYVKFLETKTVTKPIVIDEKMGVILEGHEIFQALQLLSAEKMPVFKVSLSEVQIDPPHLKEIIVKTGVKGFKIPTGNLKITLKEKIPKINVTLKELGVWKKKGKEVLRVYNSVLELLYKGWPTPLVKLASLSSKNRSVWAKLEGYNPFSNSVKDRIGWSMIMEALEEGELEDILYEATSTNTGIALASIANILGKKAKLFIPQTIQKVSDIFLKVLGAEVVRMPVSLTVEAISEVDSEAKNVGATHLNQFENDANFKVHLKYTAKEIDEQLRSIGLTPTHIIGGLGTSGHMSAISLYFKSRYGDDVKIIGVQPAPEEIIPGIRRIESGMKWYHWVKFDEVVDVKREEAVEKSIEIARKEGLLIGLSSGAVVHAFTKIAEEKGVYVLVFPDTGYKYAEQFEEYLTKIKATQTQT